MIIRCALPGDAAAACAVLRASITELCGDHHEHRPEVLASWLANKTVENLAAWIADPMAVMLVAEVDGAVAAVGCVRKDDGQVTLNYVSPAFRLRGVSKAMMATLEDEARALGQARVTLESTRTAHRFYRSIGYVDTGAAFEKHGLPGFPMVKRLLPRTQKPAMMLPHHGA